MTFTATEKFDCAKRELKMRKGVRTWSGHMAISPEVADEAAEIILSEMDRDEALRVLQELRGVDGGQSFNETIEMIYMRVRDSQGCGP